MSVQIRIPTPLRKLTHDEEVVETSAENVGAAIADLESRYPGIQERLLGVLDPRPLLARR